MFAKDNWRTSAIIMFRRFLKEGGAGGGVPSNTSNTDQNFGERVLISHSVYDLCVVTKMTQEQKKKSLNS